MSDVGGHDALAAAARPVVELSYAPVVEGAAFRIALTLIAATPLPLAVDQINRWGFYLYAFKTGLSVSGATPWQLSIAAIVSVVSFGTSAAVAVLAWRARWHGRVKAVVVACAAHLVVLFAAATITVVLYWLDVNSLPPDYRTWYTVQSALLAVGSATPPAVALWAVRRLGDRA